MPCLIEIMFDIQKGNRNAELLNITMEILAPHGNYHLSMMIVLVVSARKLAIILSVFHLYCEKAILHCVEQVYRVRSYYHHNSSFEIHNLSFYKCKSLRCNKSVLTLFSSFQARCTFHIANDINEYRLRKEKMLCAGDFSFFPPLSLSPPFSSCLHNRSV